MCKFSFTGALCSRNTWRHVIRDLKMGRSARASVLRPGEGAKAEDFPHPAKTRDIRHTLVLRLLLTSFGRNDFGAAATELVFQEPRTGGRLAIYLRRLEFPTTSRLQSLIREVLAGAR